MPSPYMLAAYLFLMLVPVFLEAMPTIKTVGVLTKIKLFAVSIGAAFAATGHGNEVLVFAIAIGYIDKLIYHGFLKK